MANNKTVYVVTTGEGTVELTTVKEVSKALGTKVTKKGIEAGEYPEVTLASATTVEVEPTPEPEVTEQDTKAEQHKQQVLEAIEKAMEALDATENPTLFDQLCELEDAINDGMELTEEQAQVAVQVLQGTYLPTQEEEDTTLTDTPVEDTEEPTEESTEEASVDSDKEYPEVGSFETDKAMKKYIKGLTDAELQEWCELEGATWKPNEHQSINRMRMAMAIKALHFPDTAPKKSKKSKSKYADYTTEQLVEMALDNNVEVKDDKGNERILRMYTIMALREAGIIE